VLKLPISVCIPVRNEEAMLPACLDALAGAFDDVVVVDSRSTDATCSIAAEKGASVAHFEWDGRFPKKRNWALRNISFRHPWILFLDADEILTPAFIAEVRRTLPGTRHVGFWVRFTNHFLGRPLRHGDVFRKLSLFRRDSGEYEAFPEEWWSSLDMEVHEHPILRGSIGELREAVDHRDDRGLHHYIAKHNDYSSWEARRHAWLRTASPEVWSTLTRRQRFKYRHLRKWWFGHLYFWSCVLLKRGFLDGRAGWQFAGMKKRYFADVRLKIRELAGRGG